MKWDKYATTALTIQTNSRARKANFRRRDVFFHTGVRQSVETKSRAVREVYFCAAAPRCQVARINPRRSAACCRYRVAGDLGLDLQPNCSERATDDSVPFPLRNGRTKRVASSLLPTRPRAFVTSCLHSAYIRPVSVATTTRALSWLEIP